MSGGLRGKQVNKGRPFGGGFLLGRISRDCEVKMNDKSVIEFSNYRLLIKELKEFEGNALREFYQNAKDIAKPVQAYIQKSIPNAAPLSGMRGKSERARLGWGVGVRPRTVKIRVNKTVQRGSSFAKGKTNEFPIVQVAASSPALVMADMAGKTNAYTDKKPRSRVYQINLFGLGQIVERTHKIDGQGVAMIAALSAGVKGGRGKPSRWFWPAAEKGMEDAAKQMDDLLQDTIDTVNKRLGT